MNKYNVGDVVKLRDDLEDYRTYNELWAGKISTIKKNPVEIKDIEFDGTYRSSTGWIINDEMIEGLWEECKENQDKLKLIDVLNMIAKGELKEGTKVKLLHDNTIYKLDCDELVSEEDYKEIFELYSLEVLAEEVELIEPPCEHEWEIETIRNGIGDLRRFRRCVKCGFREEADKCIPDEGKTSEPSKIEELKYDVTDLDCLGIHNKTISLNIADKLNEIINKVNAQTEVILAQRKDIDEIKEQLDY